MNESISIVIGILGLVGTIYSIVAFAKKRKYPGELTIVRENSVGLFNELANSFTEISIQFENAPIDKNIVHIKGSIVNSGEIDLDLSQSEQPLQFMLDTGLKWIKTKVLKSSRDVNCSVVISDDLTIDFECGILKVDEFFQFEALIEISNSETNYSEIFDKIKTSHRILNTKKISVIRYLTKDERSDDGLDFKELVLRFGIFLGIFLIYTAVNTYIVKSTQFQYINNQVTYTVVPSADGTITATNVLNSKDHDIDIKTFQEQYTPNVPTKESFWEDFISRWIYMLVIGLLYIFISLYEFFTFRKSENVSRIIEG